jgi:hypothetical protein
MDAISRGSTVTNDQLADVKSAKAVQRLIDFQEGRKGIVDAASGLTVGDIECVIKLATSAQAARLRESAEADIETADPERLVPLLTTAILNTMAETSEKLLGAPGLPSSAAFDAIAGVLAVLATADPEHADTKTIREAVDDVARRAKVGAAKLKQMHQESGYQVMATTRPTVN